MKQGRNVKKEYKQTEYCFKLNSVAMRIQSIGTALTNHQSSWFVELELISEGRMDLGLMEREIKQFLTWRKCGTKK